MKKEKNISISKKDNVISVIKTIEDITEYNPTELQNRKIYLEEQMKISLDHYNRYLELKSELDALNSIK